MIPEEVGERYLSAFGILGVENVRLMHIKTEADALQPDYLERIRRADGVMFSGGDQARITRMFLNTQILDILKQRYWQEEFVIAGTSAGAMAMSRLMIKGGSAKASLLKGAVKVSKGLDLLDHVVIDTHFVVRGRFGRLMEAVATYPKTIGIGLGEDTGVLITNGKMIETIGSNLVVIADGYNIGYTNVAEVEKGRPVAIENMIMHVLAKGNIFDIESRHFFKDAAALKLAHVQEAAE